MPNHSSWITPLEHTGTYKPCIASDHIPISKKLTEREPISTYTYNASEEYFIDHTQMEKYTEVLEPGNVVVIDCGVQKFRETKWTNRFKVGFKISGISYVYKGFPPLDELSLLGASPSKKKF